MMRRHFIPMLVPGALTALLVWFGGVSGIQAADVKTPPPAPPAAAAKSEPRKPASPPAAVAAKTAPAPAVAAPAAAKASPEKAPAAGMPGAAPAAAQGPASPAAAPGAAQPAPQVPAQGYVIMGKSDPFRPFMETDLATKLKKEEELKKRELRKVGRPISPLQQADIAQFRLVGIAGGGDKRTAVVEDATGKRYYPLFVGTYIGQNGGRVSAILDDRVIVEERITDHDQDGKPAKKAKIRRVTVMLHKEKEEGKQ